MEYQSCHFTKKSIPLFTTAGCSQEEITAIVQKDFAVELRGLPSISSSCEYLNSHPENSAGFTRFWGIQSPELFCKKLGTK